MWLGIGYYPAYDAEKNIIGVTYTTTDISEKMYAQERLKESQTILESLYNSSAEASIYLNTDLKILYINSSAKHLNNELFGKESESGNHILDFKLPAFKADFNDYYALVLNGKSVSVEKNCNGGWWVFSMFPVYGNENEIVGIAENARNITQDKNYLNKIISQNQALNQIAWEQSHLVRRPLANILALTELMKIESNPEEMEKLIKLTETSAIELDVIIHNINAISQE